MAMDQTPFAFFASKDMRHAVGPAGDILYTGDVLVVISTSGNSPNILRAAEVARERGIVVIGFTGKGGGKLAGLCDPCFRVPSDETPRIQEGHEFIGHLLCALIEAQMHPRDAG